MKPLTVWLWCLIVFLLAGCASVPPAGQSSITPGYQPPAQSDEAELWFAMRRFEADLEKSPARVRDPELNAYVRELSCRVAADLCPDIRVYVLRSPYFNAFMAPNGMMVVFSGLLLRVSSEAELAFVLAHEVGHYQQQHSLKNWRQTKNVGNVFAGIQLIAGGMGSGAVALAGAIGANANLAAFSREQEREADAYGYARLRELGYDLEAPGLLWAAIWEEDRVNPRGLLSSVFASHPATEERWRTLREKAAAEQIQGDARAELLIGRLASFRAAWLEDELARRNYTQTRVLLDRLKQTPANRAETLYFEGELYRKRAQDGDLERALAAYDLAATDRNAPAELWRDRGLVLRRVGRSNEAAADFRRYLERAPDADDRAMIEHYLGGSDGP
jgi:predicted Zn-dependent protease